MKFGKRLQSQIEETLPEWRDKFLSYKQLKKRLKLIAAPDCFTDAAFDCPSTPPGNADHHASRGSAVDAVDEELRRGSQAGGPAAIQEKMLQTQMMKAPPPPPVEAQMASGQTKKVNCCQKRDVIIPAAGGGEKGPKNSSKIKCSELLEGGGGGASRLWSSSEMEFVGLLNNELRKFNLFFIEKEEEYVIRLQELKERIERVKRQREANYEDPIRSIGDDEVLRIFRDIVTFHGEMVLLENYSSLNYTGLVKILKKHDKRTGAVLRMPYIQSVLLQPFFTTELLSKLVRECERNLQSLLSVPFENSSLLNLGDSHPESPFDIWNQGQGTSCEAVETIYRSTLTALRTIQDIRQGSSTRSIFSMPPVDNAKNENENHNKSVINERTASVVAVIQ